jgi:hypothetical protein
MKMKVVSFSLVITITLFILSNMSIGAAANEPSNFGFTFTNEIGGKVLSLRWDSPAAATGNDLVYMELVDNNGVVAYTDSEYMYIGGRVLNSCPIAFALHDSNFKAGKYTIVLYTAKWDTKMGPTNKTPLHQTLSIDVALDQVPIEVNKIVRTNNPSEFYPTYCTATSM